MNERQLVKIFMSRQSDSIQQVIKRTCIVDFGVIIKVLGKSVVRVGISVADSPEDVQIITCTLVNSCSSAIAVDVEPSVGDKVLVLFPRHYNPKMFNINVQEPVIDDSIKGYTRYAGLAFLVNQFSEDYKATVKVSKDKNITVDNGKVSVKVSDEITVDNGKAKVTIDSNGNVTIESQGKYTIKNNVTDLKDVINSLADKVKNLSTTGESLPPGQVETFVTTPGTIASIELWENTKLNQLFR